MGRGVHPLQTLRGELRPRLDQHRRRFRRAAQAQCVIQRGEAVLRQRFDLCPGFKQYFDRLGVARGGCQVERRFPSGNHHQSARGRPDGVSGCPCVYIRPGSYQLTEHGRIVVRKHQRGPGPGPLPRQVHIRSQFEQHAHKAQVPGGDRPDERCLSARIADGKVDIGATSNERPNSGTVPAGQGTPKLSLQGRVRHDEQDQRREPPTTGLRIESELSGWRPFAACGGSFYFGGNWNRPSTIPGTVMSSSSSSQRKAYPLTSTWTRASCSVVAAARIRNRSAGKPIVRPSWSSTFIVRPSAHARTAAGSTASRGSSVMVLIECPSQYVLMLKNQLFNAS